MKQDIYSAECRFCHQMIQLDIPELTPEQAEEEATMRCKCNDAYMYQKEKNRKKKAMSNVDALFERENEVVLDILKQSIEAICDDRMEKITLNLYGGVKATISQNSKGEINVERTVTKKQKLTE